MYDLTEALTRLAAMQEEAIAGSDAKPYWPYVQEAMPYWWNRINGMTVRTDLAADADIDVYTVEMGLVVAHLTEGYDGERGDKVTGYIVDVLEHVAEHPLLTSAAYPDELRWLWIEDGGAVITGIPNGTRAIANTGSGPTQVVIGFILTLPLMRERIY